MIKGFYAAASAMLAGVARQKVLAHNAANVDTPGFKQILSSLDDWRQTGVFTPPSTIGQPGYVGNLGLGVEMGAEFNDFSDGGVRSTRHPYDVAISGGGFFRVSTPDGERYTRDGRFIRDADGTLVTVDGFAVLTEGGQEITIPEDGVPSISSTGLVSVNGEEVAQLGLAGFENPEATLVRAESNTFTSTAQPDADIEVRVAQGYLEMSNVNPSTLMTQMVAVMRAYEAAQKMVSSQDELLGRAISTLGRSS